ncbi:MAG: four helix bundle protein [Candidatus Cloacimonetes bacterium]|nr:four helix bundle protein [Candidatus Cloacimonadota bacterium]
MGNFRKLEVWQLAKDLSVYIYKLTGKDKFAKDYDLRGQIRKAAVSIPSNVAEGDESGSNKQSIRYFNIAKGSSAEVQTQSIIAFEIGYISIEENSEIINRCEIISKKLVNLIKFRSQHLTPNTQHPTPNT